MIGLIDITEPPIPLEQSLSEFPDGWPYQRLRWKKSARSYLLPILQCTLQCMRHTQKCITGSQTFPISNLCGSKHTTAFHKSSEANRHLALKHLRQYWCYGNRSVVGNRGRRWTFWNRGDICLTPASRETTQTNKPPKHYKDVGPEHQQFS